MLDDGEVQTGGGAEPSTPEGRKRKCQEMRTLPACRYRSVFRVWRQEGCERRHHSCQLTCQRVEPHLPHQKPQSGPETAGGRNPFSACGDSKPV